MGLESAIQSPDGKWRVEAIRRGTSRWYRIVHELPHDNQDVIDWFYTAAVQRILAEAGVDMALLVEAEPAV